ncbi:MAG TPA: hypothetical protein VIM79_16340 [Niastella sp.]
MESPEENILLVQQELAKDFSICTTNSKQKLLQELAVAINHLIQTDFAQLINILYRIDISERTLKETLQQHVNEDAGMLIARLIIERQLQKQKVRAQFRSQENIPDDDKW